MATTPVEGASAPPLVSIVTPSLNQGRFIEDAVRSVLAQDYPRVEYVVVDGGSTDQTLDVLRGHGGALRWISEPDSGQAAAINKGFRGTSGEILGWLNADDLYEPSAISTAVTYLRDHPETALVYGDATHVDVLGHTLGPCAYVEPANVERLIHEVDYIVQPASFFRRSAFEAVGLLDESLNWALDYDLWLKIARRFPIAYVPRPLARYRLTGDNKTARGRFERFAELDRVGRRHGAGGLAAVFRVDLFWLSIKEARRLALQGSLWPAARMAGRAGGALFLSPRAMRHFLRLCVDKLRRGERPPRGVAPR
jgi:glycosyltransferase involved in cell wall biosynthesis